MTAAGWLITLPLAGLVLARLTRWDAWLIVVGALAITPIIFLPAYPVAVVAAANRRWTLAVVAACVIVLHLWWTVPELWPYRAAAQPAPGAIRLRIFDANVRYDNPDVGRIGAQIAAAHPDVVVLEEFTYRHAAQLAPVLSAYPHTFVRPAGDADGIGVWSNFALDGMEAWMASAHPEIRGWVQVGATRVRLYAFHSTAPLGASGVGEWKRQLAAVRDAVRHDIGAAIVAGDFNATVFQHELTALLRHLRDAADVRGQGRLPTWPEGNRWLPPLIRIDHVLVSPGITVTGYRLGHGQGSDHRPLIVDLAIPRAG